VGQIVFRRRNSSSTTLEPDLNGPLVWTLIFKSTPFLRAAAFRLCISDGALAGWFEGVKITGSNPETKVSSSSTNQVCEACQLANAPRQISRRKIGQAYGVLGRVHFDLVQNQPAYNRHVWLTHFYLDGIRCHFVFTHVKKSDCQWAVRKFIALIRTWLNVKIRVFHYSNERSAGNEIENILEAEGCIIEHSLPGTPEMNGPAERSGGVIVRMARSLVNKNPDLPKTLWLEDLYVSIYPKSDADKT
jgi:hypothetical protein